MGIRTDLAAESTNLTETDGYYCDKNGNFELHYAKITKQNDIDKPSGKYLTLYFENIENITDLNPFREQFLKAMTTFNLKAKNVLVVGLGNRDITADSIGPKTAEKVLATRHVVGSFAEGIGLSGLESVAVAIPDVLGKTGVEAQELIAGLITKINADAVIVIDALCAKNESRIFKTIQFTDSGIAPGSGVQNKRREISKETLGVEVIAIGVPTVIEFPSDCENLIVTPKDCDLLTDKISEAIAQGLNLYLQPNIDPEVLLNLV